MTEPRGKGEEELEWVQVGTLQELGERKCRRLYTASGKDLALFNLNGQFYACTATCPHAGGPMDQADIEDLGNDQVSVTCPLHFYSFNLPSGSSPTGLKLAVYQTRITDDVLFVLAPEPVRLKR